MKSNIDLTEQRDFGDKSPIAFSSALRLSIELTESADSALMTRDDFEKLSLYRKVFGRRSHENGKDRIFDYNKKFEEKWRYRCLRCGKIIRIPWKNFGGVCKKCDNDMCSHTGKKIFPWTIFKIERNANNDLFSSR